MTHVEVRAHADLRRNPLARVADSSGVSKAELFTQFPTKAQLFEATVLEVAFTSDTELGDLPSDDSVRDLSTSAVPTPTCWPGRGSLR